MPTFDPTPAWDPTTGEVVEPARSITGLDGKTYTRPAPQEDADDMPQKITRKRTPYPVVVDRAAADTFEPAPAPAGVELPPR